MSKLINPQVAIERRSGKIEKVENTLLHKLISGARIDPDDVSSRDYEILVEEAIGAGVFVSGNVRSRRDPEWRSAYSPYVGGCYRLHYDADRNEIRTS